MNLLVVLLNYHWWCIPREQLNDGAVAKKNYQENDWIVIKHLFYIFHLHYIYYYNIILYSSELKNTRMYHHLLNFYNWLMVRFQCNTFTSWKVCEISFLLKIYATFFITKYTLHFKGTLMQIWKSLNIFAWK